MKGQILDADGAARSGLINGDDGNRYRFTSGDWKPGVLPLPGANVDFVADGETARDIFLVPGQASAAPAEPLRVVAPTQPGDRSVLYGVLGIGCIVLAFIFPPLPVLGAIVFGLIGAGHGKRYDNGTGLTLSRISWIGGVVIGALMTAVIVWAMIYAWPLFELFFYYLMAVFNEAATTA